MYDRWIDGRSCTIINFLISCSQGTKFLKSVDESDQVKGAQLIFCLFNEVVEDVGVENVVQIIANNASNYVLAGNLFENKHPII